MKKIYCLLGFIACVFYACLEDKGNVYKKIALRFAQNEKFHTELSFRPDESVLKIDRKFSGSERALVHQRRSLYFDTV